MATFSNDAIAGRGFNIPYAYSTINDIVSSTGVEKGYGINGSLSRYDMVNSPFDVDVNFSDWGGGNYTLRGVSFSINNNYTGAIADLYLDINANTGHSWNDTVVNNGNDTFLSSDFPDLIHGGMGDDVIWGGAGIDTLYGDSGNDYIAGGENNDFIDGGMGNDTARFSGNSWEYVVSRHDYGDVTITHTGGVGRDASDYLTNVEMFSFNDGEFTLNQLSPVGGASPSPPPLPPAERANIYGTAGNDSLHGNALDNSLFGGAGRDTLWGGAGKDAFVFDTSPKSGRDFIKDFYVPEDTIKIDNADFTRIGGGGKLKASAFFSNNTGNAHDANDRVIYDKDSGKLYYDADGTGSKAGVCFSDISKNLKLTAADFFVI